MSSHPGASSRFKTEAAVNAMPPYRTCSNVDNCCAEGGAGAGGAAFFDSWTNSFVLRVGGDNSCRSEEDDEDAKRAKHTARCRRRWVLLFPNIAGVKVALALLNERSAEEEHPLLAAATTLILAPLLEFKAPEVTTEEEEQEEEEAKERPTTTEAMFENVDLFVSLE